MREFLFQAAALAGERFGFGGVSILGRFVGRLLWWCLPFRRKMATEMVANHLELPLSSAQQIAKQSFMHTGRSFCEAFLTRLVDWRFVRDQLEIRTPDRLRDLQESKGPVVLACAHLGAWELLAGILQLFMPRPAKAIVVREGRDAALNQLMRRQRGRPGVSIIGHRGAASKVLRILKQGGACAFLVDHNAQTKEAIFLPFLKDVAAVNAGPALLALRAKAVVWPVFLVRTPTGRYALYLEAPLHTEHLTGSQAQRLEQVAVFYTQAVERYIHRFPDQWFWMHKRWKTRPPTQQ